MGSDGMEKYKYADTAKINVKPDGSVVCSLYVNDSKEKKEYFKNAARMKKAAGSNGNSKKKRTVTVSKSTKAKHRDKLKVESYLQANSWEYVLRVPITSVDHQTTWTKFKQRYNYKHKDHPLQYVMVKGDGELYGAISNAPVENGKIPLVNVEHSIVSAYDKSVIKQLTGLSLQYKYKGKEHSYTSSNGLKEKTFEFVNLGGIEYFSLPDDALVTQMQASLVFNGGTVEENLEAARRFIEEKRVKEVARDFAGTAKTNIYKEHGEWFPYLIGNVLPMEKLVYNVPVVKKYNGQQIEFNAIQYDGKVVFAQTQKGDYIQFLLPCVYFIIHNDTGLIYYIGSTRTPIHRYCNHFGINTYYGVSDKGKPYKNSSGFYEYVIRHGLDFGDFRMLYMPMTYWEMDSLSGVKTKMSYCPFFEYDLETGKRDEQLRMAEAYLHEIFKNSEHVFVPERNEDCPEKEDGIYPIFLNSDDTRKKCAANYKKYKEQYLDIGMCPVTSCFELHGGFYDMVEIYKFLEYRDRVDDKWWYDLRSEHVKFMSKVVPNNTRFKKHDDNLVRGEIGVQIGMNSWSEDGKTVTRSFCYAVDGCIGKMSSNNYPCFNGKPCKCYELSQSQTVFSDEPEPDEYEVYLGEPDEYGI